jgi:UPF0755 protein
MRKAITIFILLIFLVSATIIWWQHGAAAANPKESGRKMFVIPQGMGLREITKKLKQEGIITDPVVFFLLVKIKGLDKKIQAGDYFLSPSQTATEIMQMLTKGSMDVWVTIPEGKRAEEIAEILSKSIPSYDPSWRSELNKYEGYLFPDTYLIPKNSTVNEVVSLLTRTFEQKYSTITNGSGLSKEKIVIIASLIEREAKHEIDRPLVSSVIHNRLAIGMKLDIDATIQYALGNTRDPKTWWPTITKDDYKNVQSPFNTYLFSGLPPTPIANPGLASLKGAANPADTPYLYYISDANGNNHYARTIEEHNENIRKYGL